MMTQREKMFEVVEEYLRSGKSRNAYCSQNSISPSTFTYWQQKYKKQKQESSGFVKIDSTKAHCLQEIEIVFPNQVRIKSSSLSLNDLKALLQLY